MICGLVRTEAYGTILTNPGPYLSIRPRGIPSTFSFTEERDQWAILLDLPGLKKGPRPGTVALANDMTGGWATLPMFTPIVAEHVSGWEGEFLRIQEAFKTPSPANGLRVQLGVGNVLRYIIDQHRDIYPAAAAKLRWLIDEDQECRHNLEELSRKCGYSAGRLRHLFEREYGISPQDYRNKVRMTLAANLLCNSDLRVKEVSERLGCRHASHLSALFKSAFGITPTKYRAKVNRERAVHPTFNHDTPRP